MAIKFKPRKTQKIQTSLWISLPYEWAAHHELERGQLIDVLLTPEQNLLLVPQEKQAKEPAKTDNTPAPLTTQKPLDKIPAEARFDMVEPVLPEAEPAKKPRWAVWG